MRLSQWDFSWPDCPPVPPPRPKRRSKTNVRNLQLKTQFCSLDENSHQNDILFRTDSREGKRENVLKGGSLYLIYIPPCSFSQTWQPLGNLCHIHSSMKVGKFIWRSGPCQKLILFNRPDVAGAVLQTEASLPNQMETCETLVRLSRLCWNFNRVFLLLELFVIPTI